MTSCGLENALTEMMLSCEQLVVHLHQGNFSLLAPAFEPMGSQAPRVLQFQRDGCFEGRPEALAEAFTCAAFLGALDVVEALLAAGVPAQGGNGTGMDALHWAANRGQLAVVRRLLGAGAAIEVPNRFGGTVLGASVWSSVNEPRPTHPAIVALLLAAGADVTQAAFPSGHAEIDALLEQYGARVG